MSTLQGRQHNNTYLDLLHIENSNQGFDTILRRIESGNGNESALSLSTGAVSVTGAFSVAGAVAFTQTPTVGGTNVALSGPNVNNNYIQWRNVADNADIDVLRLNSSDQIELGTNSSVSTIVNGGTGDASLSRAGERSVSSQSRTSAGSTSSGAVLDNNDVSRSIGFNEMPPSRLSGAQTIDRDQSGYQLINTGSAATWNIDDTDAPQGVTYLIINAGSGALTLTAGNINWYDGSAITAGNRTLAVGGVATISRDVAADTYSIWGNGLT